MYRLQFKKTKVRERNFESLNKTRLLLVIIRIDQNLSQMKYRIKSLILHADGDHFYSSIVDTIDHTHRSNYKSVTADVFHFIEINSYEINIRESNV